MASQVERTSLSDYIISYAQAAKTAQKLMSDGEDAMAIKEFRFLVNLSTTEVFKSETGISLNIWRANIKQQLTYEKTSETSLEVECTIVPVYTINTGGD